MYYSDKLTNSMLFYSSLYILYFPFLSCSVLHCLFQSCMVQQGYIQCISSVLHACSFIMYVFFGVVRFLPTVPILDSTHMVKKFCNLLSYHQPWHVLWLFSCRATQHLTLFVCLSACPKLFLHCRWGGLTKATYQLQQKNKINKLGLSCAKLSSSWLQA